MAAAAQPHVLDGGIICGICHTERLREIGQLDCCFHRWEFVMRIFIMF